ncbi:MAG: GtrA family protein [Hyphomicrobiaceae bacterium]
MADNVSSARHWGGFLLAGVSALVVDAGILHLLTAGFGVSPFIARPFGIACAMVVSWAINRRVTFAVAAKPSLAEFGKFAAASFAGQVINYLVFAAILLAYPAAHPTLAIVIASVVAMFVSYAGFRFGAFRAPDPKG